MADTQALFPPDSSAGQFLECLLVLDEDVANTADNWEEGGASQELYDELASNPVFVAAWQIVELGHEMLAEFYALVQTIELIENKMRSEVRELILPPGAREGLVTPE